LYSFSMSAGSFSLVASFMLISIISLKSSKFVLKLWRMGFGFLCITDVLIVAMIGVWSDVRSELAVALI
jgi:hypothetical protein